MKEEISLDIAMSKEEMAKIKELLTSSPGLRHYAFELKTGEYLDLVEYKDYEKLEEENKSLQSQLKAKEEVIKKFEKYLNDCVSELENNYGTSSIQNAINTGIVDITKVILSKFNEILSKGENK